MIPYENADPIANKYLQADGSITTFDGTVISPASEAGAQRYLQADAIPNKWLNPDGSISTFPPMVPASTEEGAHS
jgi:formylmethanofuran:tetrahydromethanopterin formyltransferase